MSRANESLEVSWCVWRLFLTGQISRFDGTVASIKRASIISGRGGRGQSPMGRGGRGRRSGDDDDDSRPGPIFLRSVVTRQFKYRWLVLAISVFFSMAVIVALSVVYSNRWDGPSLSVTWNYPVLRRPSAALQPLRDTSSITIVGKFGLVNFKLLLQLNRNCLTMVWWSINVSYCWIRADIELQNKSHVWLQFLRWQFKRGKRLL